jgi:prophage regulatory protein
MAETTLERWYSTRRLVETFGIGRNTILRARKAGTFPKGRMLTPGRLAYRESDILRWLASREER